MNPWPGGPLFLTDVTSNFTSVSDDDAGGAGACSCALDAVAATAVEDPSMARACQSRVVESSLRDHGSSMRAACVEYAILPSGHAMDKHEPITTVNANRRRDVERTLLA